MFIENKYCKWYYNIISNAKSRTISGYTEKHHIIPKSMGGDNSKDNLIKLTAREHFICHRLLTKMTTGKYKLKMIFAVFLMSHATKSVRVTSRTYEYLRVHFSLSQKQLHQEDPTLGLRKANKGEKNGMYGKTHTDEVRKIISETAKRASGKTYEERYGEEDAARLKEIRSLKLKELIAANPGCRDGAKNPKSRTCIFVDPAGNEFTLNGTQKVFCKQHSLSYAVMGAILRGDYGDKLHKGWTARYVD